jgi:BirA family transcriptional regulator, biotin operon repressor / biotin---[acetyl-CoA-carboxylase] ligase
MTEDLTPDRIQRNLHSTIVGRAIEYYAQAGSTNELARRHARAGHPQGLVVVANAQTAGRGRMGRAWPAPPGSSLLLSLLLRPAWLAPADAFSLTMLASVALCEAVEQITPPRAALKWPNDLLLPVRTVGGPTLRKAAGILSELELVGDQIAWVVIGIGVNVSWSPSGIVDGRDLAEVATSVGAAAGQPVGRLALLRALLERLDARYVALRRGDHADLFESWRDRLTTLGQPVQIGLPHGELRGVAEDVERSGALRVRDEHGVLHTVLAGDVGG